MDSVHCHVNNLSRRKPDGGERSAVAAASYISGLALWNEREQGISNFGRRRDVVHRELMVPKEAPEWCRDREQLWNLVDTTAKRKDARLAKTIEAALSRDIPRDQWISVLRDFVAPYVAAGMVADIAIHDDGTGHNPHVHVMLTVRSLKPNGFGSKIPNVDHKSFVTTARRGWETISNQYLEASGSSVRLDRRSYKARGIQQEPTKHRGPNQAERRLKRIRAQAHYQQREEAMQKPPTRKERVTYPLLTQRDDWPPVDQQPEADMSREERSELKQYWDDRQLEAQQANEKEIEERQVAGWFNQTERDAEIRRRQPTYEAPAWYDTAVERARSEADPAETFTFVREEERPSFEQELAERHAKYEKSVASRAVNQGTTRHERELLEFAKGASPAVRARLEHFVMDERMRRIRDKDDAKRLAELEKSMNPTLRERFGAFVADQRERMRTEPLPKPGPYQDPYPPSELEKARDQMREEYEREEEERRR